jgi:parallel beta-helix repeat protein
MTEIARRKFLRTSAAAFGTGVGLSAGSLAHAGNPEAAREASVGPYLNIRDFGAQGDGHADDTRALQNAMAKAEVESGVVYFPPGHYCIQPVKVPSQITLMGHSAWACVDRGLAPGFRGRTVLTPLSADARAFLDLEGKVGTRIQGLSLDGRNLKPRMHGIYVSQLGVENGVVIEDCRIERFSGSGVRLDNAWVAAVRRCLISGCGEHGIDLSGSYDIWIIDNEIGAKGAAIYAISDTYAGELPEPRFAAAQKPEPNLDPRRSPSKIRKGWGVGASTITACRLEWCKLGGIVLYDSESIQINGCSLDHNFGPGIMLTNCRAMTITGCLLRSNGADRLDEMSCHLRLEKCQGISATGNSLFGWFERKEHTFLAPTPFYGMVLRNLDASVITANALYQSASKEGILDHGGHTASVISNNMHTAPNLKGRTYPAETKKG